ncbi:SET domain-containing protein [Balamuthia mandrillaris]
MRITRSASKGREVRANRSFSKGQTLLVLEPYVHTLNTDHLLRCCHWCLRGKDNVGGPDSRPLSLRRCSGCKYRRYCSVDCQRKDWEGLHRSECNILQSIGTPQHVPPAPLLLLWRLLLLREKARRTGKKNAFCQYDLVQSLHSHQEDYSSERKEQLAMMAAMACKHLSAASSPSSYSSGEEGYASREGIAYALDLLCMLSCNCFTISTDEMNTVGVGLYPQAALINHSCQPNCVSLFVGASFHLRSIVDINEGDEITLNYVHIGDPTEQRRKALRETFFFECQCTRCQQFMPLETVLSTNAERLIAKAEKTFDEAQALKKRNGFISVFFSFFAFCLPFVTSLLFCSLASFFHFLPFLSLVLLLLHFLFSYSKLVYSRNTKRSKRQTRKSV